MSNQKDDGIPAFPIPGLHSIEECNGMTLRDYFAAKAMQSLISAANGVMFGSSEKGQGNISEYSYVAYLIADGMMEARES